jgi:hypothetical protein
MAKPTDLPTALDATWDTLRRVRKHAKVHTVGGWTIEREARRLTHDGKNLQLTIKAIVDHPQNRNDGTILRFEFTTITAVSYIKGFSNPPEHWWRDGKIRITMRGHWKDGKWVVDERHCDPNELLLMVDSHTIIATLGEDLRTIIQAVNRELHYDGSY